MPYPAEHRHLTKPKIAKIRRVAAGTDAYARWARRRGNVRFLHADHGVMDAVYGPYLEGLGWRFTSTRDLPRGRGVHLRADELPRGRLIVRLPGHLVAVVDGVIHDTNDCSEEGRRRIRGYWSAPSSKEASQRGA